MLAAVGVAAMAWTGADAYAAGVGQRCGGFIGLRCAKGLWCDPKPGVCGADVPGRCVRVPQICSDLYMPVCGCNGRTFSNDCWRIMNKEPKRRNGQC
jgi:hypothetical protein